MIEDLQYKSYCWCLGTTSFRTKEINLKIEKQLTLIDEFWETHEGEPWDNSLQSQYYYFLQEKEFVQGDARRPDKDAREKTSSLADLGLVTEDRKITSVGQKLIKISSEGNFAPSEDDFLKLDKDCFIYLKQLLKTSYLFGEQPVRPFIVFLYLITKLRYLTRQEFELCLPLCIDKKSTEEILNLISLVRQGKKSFDELILERLFNLPNYKKGLQVIIEADEVTTDLIMAVGMNRKSRTYDITYYPVYKLLQKLYLDHDYSVVVDLLEALKKLNTKTDWISLFFDNGNVSTVKKNPLEHLVENEFNHISNELELRSCFFRTMHLIKAKHTLRDYFDLNRRYFSISGIVLFKDEMVSLDFIPKFYFDSVIDGLYSEAFKTSNLIYEDCSLSEISNSLIYSPNKIIKEINTSLHSDFTDISECYNEAEKERYRRFNILIDERFTDENLYLLLDYFAVRNDEGIQNIVKADEADIPTIFEYVLGIIWYKISNREGKILDYMKLSFTADLLPKTHAAGGEADIVYEYQACSTYPRHDLLLEATLTERTNQRRAEMEPVSRHLGNKILETNNMKTYVVFATNDLNPNVISDFRARKNITYYDPIDYTHFIEGMKIIPLAIDDLKNIISHKMHYPILYENFETAYCDNELSAIDWYTEKVKKACVPNTAYEKNLTKEEMKVAEQNKYNATSTL